MARTLYSELVCKKQRIKGKGSLSKEVSTRQVKPPLSLLNNKDLLLWLKGLALDPSNMESSQYSIQRLLHQEKLLKFRKIVMPSDDIKYLKMKRDLKHVLEDGKCSTPFVLNREKSTNQNAMKKRRVQSSISCSPYSEVKDVSSRGKQRNNAFSISNDREKCIFSYLFDSIESSKESNQVKKEHLVISSDPTQSIEKSVQEKTNIGFPQAVESLVVMNDQMKTSHSSRANKEDKKNKQAQKFLLLDHTNIRPVIPIGPKFQAEVSKWEGPTNKRDQDIDDYWRSYALKLSHQIIGLLSKVKS